MISHGTASADLNAFVHAKVIDDMADALIDSTVDITDADAVASCLISHNFGGRAIGALMDQAIEVVRSRRTPAHTVA